jgi:hypothetical protein
MRLVKKPNSADIASREIVRDYIQHFWQVATDIVNLNSDGKNKYELRREAEELILDAIDWVYKSRWPHYCGHRDYHTIELLITELWWLIYNTCTNDYHNGSYDAWYLLCSDLNKIAKHLESEYTHRLNELIDKSNAS